jgi:xanthine dehydrogenase molybdopterin-binding subunit B
VDPETGKVIIERYVMVADPGRLLNPLIVEGQLHGGIAQGVGHALLERVVFDSTSGQLLSGSFMDFALPRADDLPTFTTICNPVAGDDNPLGVKGIGEGPTTGSPPAVVNAVLDALGDCGVDAAHARAGVAGARREREALMQLFVPTTPSRPSGSGGRAGSADEGATWAAGWFRSRSRF